MKDVNSKQTVLIGIGNGVEDYLNTNHNIGFRALDVLCAKYNGKWENVGMADVAIIKKGEQEITLVKPSVLNPMSIDLKKLESYHESDKIVHNQSRLIKELSEYGYANFSSNHDKADYNSAGFGVLDLVQKGIIKEDANVAIVSDNHNSKPGKMNVIKYAKYARETENNGLKGIIALNPKLSFSRIDLGVPKGLDLSPTLDSVESKIGDNIEMGLDSFIKAFTKGKKSKNPIKNTSLTNLAAVFDAITSTQDQSKRQAILFYSKSMANLIKNKLLEENNPAPQKEKRRIGLSSLELTYSAMKVLYFLTDNHLGHLKTVKDDENLQFLFNETDKCSSKYANKRHFCSLTPPSEYLASRLESNAKKSLGVYCEVIGSTYLTSLEAMNVKNSFLVHYGIDIFDKSHYISEDSLQQLKNKINKALEDHDMIILGSNAFNIRDDFKTTASTGHKINLYEVPNDVIRIFWESYLISRAAQTNKGIAGICGGHQAIANLIGFHNDKLSQSFKRAQVINFEGQPVSVSSLHGEGVSFDPVASHRSSDGLYEAINHRRFNRLNSQEDREPVILHSKGMNEGPGSEMNNIMNDLRVTLPNGKKKIISVQYHPETQVLSSPKNREIFKKLTHDSFVASDSKTIFDSIIKNFAIMEDKCLTLEQSIGVLRPRKKVFLDDSYMDKPETNYVKFHDDTAINPKHHSKAKIESIRKEMLSKSRGFSIS